VLPTEFSEVEVKPSWYWNTLLEAVEVHVRPPSREISTAALAGKVEARERGTLQTMVSASPLDCLELYTAGAAPVVVPLVPLVLPVVVAVVVVVVLTGAPVVVAAVVAAVVVVDAPTLTPVEPEITPANLQSTEMAALKLLPLTVTRIPPY